MSTNYTSYINKLKKSPVFAMSLCSKELFHSNFWSWLIESDYKYAKVFFDNIEADRIDRVTREEHNRDLTIWANNKAYIIENKIKSIPYPEQLFGYQEKCASFASGCLTGIVQCELPKQWHFRSYKDIGESIKKIARNEETEGFKKELIMEYADMIINIYNLVYHMSKDEYKNVFIADQLSGSELEKIRFDDIIKKLQSHDLEKYFKENLKKLLTDNAGKLKISRGFSNKNALINIFYETEKYNIGISIQGNQMRRVCSGRGKHNEIFAEMKEKGFFTEYNKNDALIFGKRTSMRNRYCKYEGSIEGDSKEKNTHVYQYWIIEDFSFDTIYKEVEEQIKDIKRYI